MLITMAIAQTTGLFCFILSVLMLACSDRFKKVAQNLRADSPALFFNNMLTLLGACFLLDCHNIWRTPWYGAISILGVILFLKAISWLVFPEKMIQWTRNSCQKPYYTFWALLTMLIGILFLSAGFGPIGYL